MERKKPKTVEGKKREREREREKEKKKINRPLSCSLNMIWCRYELIQLY
jgi:hypothetical protein